MLEMMGDGAGEPDTAGLGWAKAAQGAAGHALEACARGLAERGQRGWQGLQHQRVRTVRIHHFRTSDASVADETDELGLRLEKLPRVLELGMKEPLLAMRRRDRGGGQRKARNRFIGADLLEVEMKDAKKEFGARGRRGELKGPFVGSGVVEREPKLESTRAAAGRAQLGRELLEQTLEEKKKRIERVEGVFDFMRHLKFARRFGALEKASSLAGGAFPEIARFVPEPPRDLREGQCGEVAEGVQAPVSEDAEKLVRGVRGSEGEVVE